MGNETGGLRIALVADLKYNDLRDVVQTGHYTYEGLDAYLYDCSLPFTQVAPFKRIPTSSAPTLSSSTVRSSTPCLSGRTPTSSTARCSAARFLAARRIRPSGLREVSSRRVWNGTIDHSILQWGCEFESGSNCSHSLLCEHTDTSCNAKIVNSIIAPNTGVSSGECNSSLVGPFIGFHHNSVLISGRGVSSLRGSSVVRGEGKHRLRRQHRQQPHGSSTRPGVHSWRGNLLRTRLQREVSV